MLLKVAQGNIKQSRDCHRNFKADIASLACDRSSIPHLAHRRDHEREAQGTCPESSRTQRKLRRYIPRLDVIELEVAFAEIQVFDTERRYKTPCPISHDTKEIGKSSVELVLPHDG